jgi:2-C-methyl-D-erythritol 4-phosphate cytidylyltransferase
MRTVAVVLAGGSGLRLGGTTPKQLQLLAGRTLLEHCVAAFESAPGIDEIVAVMPADLVAEATRILGDRYRKLRDVIAGGLDRPGSTSRAIDLLSRDHPGDSAIRANWGASRRESSDRPGTADCNVLFHDAARPLVDQRIIADCVAALAQCQAVGVVVPTTDTIVQMANGMMTSIPPRESLGRCQTPQGFRLSVIRRAYELAAADPDGAAFSPTDDCGMVLRYLPDVQIRVVPGSERNLKITYPADLRIAEAALAEPSGSG